jgi:hypothetical protein
MSSPPEVVRCLLDRALLDPAAVLEGDLWVDPVSRRNSSFKVQSSQGPAYFVKHGIGADGAAFVARESFVYQFLNSRFPAARPPRWLPRFYGCDESRHLLILGFSPGSLSLREFHAQRGRIPRTAALATGRALAELHRMQLPDATSGWSRGEAPPPPWPLSLHRPAVGFLQEISAANLEMIRIMQGFPDFCLLLDRLRDEWTVRSLIHFDLKADNCVIVPSPAGSAGPPEVKIVDWEISGPGDPCWDVGSVFSDYLGLWLLSIPILGDTPPQGFLELSRFPLERMHPAIRAFWSAYVRTLGLGADEAGEALLRSVRYGAGRLLQTAFEQMQSYPRLTGNVVCLLQLSWNILQRPEEASARLLGVPV